MGIRIALAGNPNCGKTTMFNDLTGASQYVGNWPGVTVEKKEGKYTRDKDVIITDLPGVYSPSPYSPEEIVTRDYLLDGGPDVVVNLVDATNLERNLYLTTQILDLGVPVVVALNMMDLVKKSGDKIDVAGLSKQLGCPIVETTALKGHGMAELMETAVKAAKAGKPAEPKMPFDAQVEEAITKIEGILGNRVSPATARWFAIKLFEGEERTVANMKLSAADLKAVEAIREEVENKLDDDAESIITSERYNAITHVIDKTMKRSHKGMTTTQKIDRVVTNRWLGLPIFVVVMALVYYLAISVGTGVVTDWANDGISGDGFLYTGGAAYEEAVGEWEGEQANIEAYLAAAEEDGIDVEGATAALEAEEPTAADESALAAFQEDAEKAGVVGIVEDEETGESAEVAAAAFATALEAEEPDASDGSWGLWIPGLGAVIGNALEAVDVAPWLQSLVMDGIVAGVGAVIGFIPQMIILFLLLALLEGCGYLARVAFIMDRVFRRFGLSGKSFIPMLVASRRHGHEDHRERERPSHDHHDDDDDPLRREDAHHRARVRCHRRRQHRGYLVDRPAVLLPGRHRHHHLRHHAEEDQDVRRPHLAVRHGASFLPHAHGEIHPDVHVGPHQGLHRQGRYDHLPVHHRHLAAHELR